MSRKLVVVSAGTYHLPFTRLVEWMEPWVSSHRDVRVVAQHGPTRPLLGADNHAVLPHRELMSLCERADAVILQGGAGGVMDMRTIRRIPIVVPRIPVDDEVVDDHQLIFTAQVEELGAIRRVTTRDALWEALDGALAGEWETRTALAEPTAGVAVASAILAELPRPLPPAERRKRLRRVLGGLVRGRTM